LKAIFSPAATFFIFGREDMIVELRAKGIDVSHYQGQIDWQAVAGAGIEFVFIKATDGCRFEDPMFETNWQGAGEAAIRRGAYHFFRPQQDATQQAKNFLSAITGQTGELPPVLDFELLAGMSVDEAQHRAETWMQVVERETRAKPILYTGPSFWRDSLNNSELFAQHPLWIAHYTGAERPILPIAWAEWTFWQHSEKGFVPGIKGPVDLNWFCGTATELDCICARINVQEVTTALVSDAGENANVT
jgi:lysozyme